MLVLFIAALGEGLANGNRQYISKLDAQLIVFLEKSDYIVSSSRLESITVRAIRRVDGVEAAGPIYTSVTEIVSSRKAAQGLAAGRRSGRCRACRRS